MGYFEAVVSPVPADKRAQYIELAEKFSGVFVELGALRVIEGLAEDVPFGERTSFPRAVQLGEEEIVSVTLIEFRDRAHRDDVMARFMAHPVMKTMAPEDFLVDGRRMIFGGFQTIAERASG